MNPILRFEPDCHACEGKLPLRLPCPKCGKGASHTHHDYPTVSLNCEVCHGLCLAPVAVYSCTNCRQQFTHGEK